MPDDYNYGIAVTVNNLASAELAKINKQLEGLGKQVQRNVKTTEKGAKDEQKAVRGYGTQIKEQLTTKKYLNNLLRQDQQTFKKTNALISEQGALSKINTEIRKKGYTAIGKADKQSLKNVAKEIKLRQKGGLQLSGWARANEEAIVKLDENFKKHSGSIRKSIGRVRAGFSGLGKIVHTVGMTFLTIIGPLFLVGAAMRMIQQITDALVGPFLKFEDGLFEVRKTADLTKNEMLALGDAIELMAQRVPLARTELVEIAATAGRLGIQGRENILNFTEVVAMMATATVLSADEAANALARVSNAFQLPIANVEYLGSIINELSNTTASNSREIVKSIENVGASGKMIGIAIDAVAAMSATLISAGMSSERSGCLDDGTEVLTKLGWKGIDEISEDDFIATRTPKGYLEYRKPKLIYRRNWNGDMIHLKTSRADILVTPDHRMLITTQYTNYEKKVEAKSLLNRGTFKIPRTCKWKGIDEKQYTLSPTAYLKKNGEIKSILDERTVDMLEWCKFMGYFLSEGSVNRRGKNHGPVELSQMDGPVKEKMWRNVELLGFVPHNHKNKGITIYNKQLYKTLEEYVGVKAPFKYVPQHIKDLDVLYLDAFLEAFIDGDGSRHKDGMKSIHTSSKRLLNDLWEISLKCGYHVSEGKYRGGFNNSQMYVLYLGKKKYATFVNRRGNVKSEHYEGRIWCPVLPPYETIMIKRNGKVAWTYQTRLRRFFTEMARNSSKMAEAMDIDAATMKISIEEDPTKAIMDYLEHLRELPSRVDKVVEAQEIFGKVGGFAVATLAENYVELEMNMSNARTELAFGTSLQREFQIATSKSSAELQILDNRIESAKSRLGEDLLPTIKSGKSILAGFYEGLANISDIMEDIINQGKPLTTTMDAFYEEVDRLNDLANDPDSYWEWLAKQMGEQERFMQDEKRQNESALGMYISIRKEKKKIAKETAPGKEPAFNVREMLQSYAIKDQIYKGTDALMGKHIKSLKEEGFFESERGSTLQKVEDMMIDMFNIERGLNAESKKGNEFLEERVALEVHREDAYRRGLETTRSGLELKKEAGTASEEELRDLKDITSMLDGRIVAGKHIVSMLSREAASERLLTKQQELRKRTLRDQDTFYISLEASVGDLADELLESENLQAELNERGLEAVMISGKLKVVTKELADGMYDVKLPLKEITKLLEKFGDVPTDSFDDWLDRMAKLREETSNLYYAIENIPTVIRELGKAFADTSKTAAQYEDLMEGLVDDGLEFIITSRGIEAVFKKQVKGMKQVGSEIIHVTDAMEEMNELNQDSITIWGELTIAQSDYEDRLNSVWGLTSSYINTLRKLGDAQLLFIEASETMPTRIQEIWRPYEKAFDEIQNLVAAGKDYEANIKIQAMVEDMHAKKMSAHSKQGRTDYDKLMGYIDDYAQSMGIVPLEIKEIEDELQLMEDLMKGISEGEIVITPDLNDTPFSDAMKRLLDADYVTSVRIEANLVEVKKQIEEVAAVAVWKPVSVEKAEVAEKGAAIQKTQEPYGKEPGPWMEDYSFMEEVSKGKPLPPYEYEDQTKTYGDVLVEGVGNVANTFVDIVETGVNAVGEQFNKEVSWIKEKWEKRPWWMGGGKAEGEMATGGPIPKTGLYTLHAGEHVLNKGETSHVKNVHAALGISNIVPSMKQGGTAGSAKNPLVSPDEVLSRMWSEINEATPHHKTEADVVDAMKEGGAVDKDGLYQLHEGEAILSKPDVDAIEKSQKTTNEGTTMNYDTKNERSNIFNTPISKAISNIKNDYNNPNNNVEGERTIHIHIGTIALDENYDVKKFINDMETMAMSG